MGKKIGIRYEDKYNMERRVALIPQHVKQLINDDLDFIVEPSAKRIYADQEYQDSGALLNIDLSEAELIFGVKEMPIGYFEPNKTYVFFSHVIKGQEYNMPLLKDMMNSKMNLIDYEKITDEFGRRMIFFGRFAGLAGMINSLWSLGQRLNIKGINNPFENIRQSHTYDSLEEAKNAVKEAGMKIAKNGIPKAIHPLTIGITGYGNVAKGAQEILDLLPGMEILPAELKEITTDHPDNIIYRTIFKEHDLVDPKSEDTEFELQHYYKNPQLYSSKFNDYIPNLSVLMNCMYWDEKYPRIVTKKYLKSNWNEDSKLIVIGDVTCDPDGSIEITHKGTEIEDPVFVYSPHSDQAKMGFQGEGILVMAVDILPSELPRESSIAFSNALLPYVKEVADCDFSQEFDHLKLPGPIKNALILHGGKLTPQFKYLSKFI